MAKQGAGLTFSISMLISFYGDRGGSDSAPKSSLSPGFIDHNRDGVR